MVFGCDSLVSDSYIMKEIKSEQVTQNKQNGSVTVYIEKYFHVPKSQLYGDREQVKKIQCVTMNAECLIADQ